MTTQTSRLPQSRRRSYSSSGTKPEQSFSRNRRPNNGTGFGSGRFGGHKRSHNNFRNNRNRARSGGGRKQPTFDPSQFINKNPIETKEEVYVPKHRFTDFGLHPRIVEAVTGQGISSPHPSKIK